MFKHLLPAIALIAAGAVVILVWGKPHTPVANPDPNHTHVDFLVMLDGQAIDFSGDEFMSGESATANTRDALHGPLSQYLHLHDGNGHVIHRHKPGLTLEDFFGSINLGFTANCILYRAPLDHDMQCSEHSWRMIVNGQERPFALSYDFTDGDKILLTTADTDSAMQEEWLTMTDDACRYSQTCPWRGKPPTESCIADPAVPCTIPGL